MSDPRARVALLGGRPGRGLPLRSQAGQCGKAREGVRAWGLRPTTGELGRRGIEGAWVVRSAEVRSGCRMPGSGNTRTMFGPEYSEPAGAARAGIPKTPSGETPGS